MTLTTAVEFMVEELNKSIGLTKFVDTCDEAYKQEILGIINQAKEMEKQQHGMTWDEGVDEYSTYNTFEQYYNETFKSE
jgi:hypothetical protein